MITTPALSTLDPAVVAAIQLELAQQLEVAYPTLDFRRGVYFDRVLLLHAALTAALRQEIADLQASMSLSDLAANPTLADADTVAALLSNYFVTPAVGSAASGPVTLVVAALAPITIASGATFEAGSIQLVAPNPTAVRTSQAAVTSANDRVLQPLPDGTYAFTITLQAAAAGSSGMLSRGASVAPDQPPPGFVSAYIEADWSGGVDAQDPVALANQLQTGLAAKAWSNRRTITSMVAAQAQFASVTLSIIGSGDAEMTRSRHGLFPISRPGYCDVYVRSSAALGQVVLTKTATLISVGPQGGTWQFSIGVDDAPGFYLATSILPAGRAPQPGGYTVTSDVRGFDLSGVAWVPDIESATEAAYSFCSTAVIQFLDTDTPTVGLMLGTSTASYTVVLATSALAGPLQSFLSGRAVRPPGGDVLVKGAVPCVARVSFRVWLPVGSAQPDQAAMAAAMAGAVNATGFPGQIYASSLAAASASLLPSGAAFGSADLFGVIRAPDGGLLYVHDSSCLAIPDLPDRNVTGRTTAFFLSPEDITINVEIMPNLQT